MADTQLQLQLNAYARWKQRQHKILGQLEPWLKQQSLYTAEIRHSIERARQALSQDSVTVAVAGEFSRGKTELINALFFSDHGRRLLPTNAGRTTMCPTEIFQDSTQPPYLRLLPIQTRRDNTDLAKLRERDDAWVSKPLTMSDPDAMQQQLREITESQRVTIEEAVELGLYRAEFAEQGLTQDELVEIPKWRLAQINYRHPLLARGLRVLDTPGMNALGGEPELTYEMLPNAQAILFVLSVDTGITRSDLDMWQQYIRRPGGRRHRGMMAVLNKTDSLWDPLRSDKEVVDSIQRQREEAARILDLDLSQVFATSALRGLLARVSGDKALEARSGIQQIEQHLSEAMVLNRRDLLMSNFTDQVRNALETVSSIVSSRLKRSMQQQGSLKELCGRSQQALDQLLQDARTEKAKYQTSVDAFNSSREQFLDQGETLKHALDLQTLDTLIDQAYQKMRGAWTTHGLRESMRLLFNEINKRMESVGEQAQSMRRMIRVIYRRFESQHGFDEMQPAMYSIVKYQVELGLLYQEAEIFRNSARTLMTEQHFVVRRYFNTIVKRVRKVFESAREDALQWIGQALEPLALEIKEHRGALTQQIRNIQHAGDSRATIAQRMQAQEREQQQLQAQLNSLRNVRQALGNLALPDDQGKVRPQLAAVKDAKQSQNP